MNSTKEVEHYTGDLYSSCFKVFDHEQWKHQGELLADQLGLTREDVVGKSCLDGGCGHGALCFRLAELGAREVRGVDLNPTPPAEELEKTSVVMFTQCSLLSLPFPDTTFDLVVSSGVIHHTVNPQQCFDEMARALKPGGKFVLGVYGKHGLFPYFLWFARLFTITFPIVSLKQVDRVVGWLKLNPIWRYQVLDYLFVPILRRYSPKEVFSFFHKHGFKNVHRVSNITKEKGDFYTKLNTSYSYDHRRFFSKIFFGYGFIVVEGIK